MKKEVCFFAQPTELSSFQFAYNLRHPFIASFVSELTLLHFVNRQTDKPRFVLGQRKRRFKILAVNRPVVRF